MDEGIVVESAANADSQVEVSHPEFKSRPRTVVRVSSQPARKVPVPCRLRV